MAILNYTTTIEASKTVNEIQINLAKHGAKAVLLNYDTSGQIEALSFLIKHGENDIPFRLPVDPDAVLRILQRQNVPSRYRNRQQAVRVAWRIVKDWVAAQMALLETDMVKMEQIFLPYMVVEDDLTLYETMANRQFLITMGKGNSE